MYTTCQLHEGAWHLRYSTVLGPPPRDISSERARRYARPSSEGHGGLWMIKISLGRMGGTTIAEVQLRETLSGGDIHELADHIESALSHSLALRVMLDGTAFRGWSDARALWGHLSFMRIHDRNIDRLAIVGATRWQRALAELTGRIMHPEERYFDEAERGRARRWLSEGIDLD